MYIVANVVYLFSFASCIWVGCYLDFVHRLINDQKFHFYLIFDLPYQKYVVLNCAFNDINKRLPQSVMIAIEDLTAKKTHKFLNIFLTFNTIWRSENIIKSTINPSMCEETVSETLFFGTFEITDARQPGNFPRAAYAS